MKRRTIFFSIVALLVTGQLGAQNTYQQEIAKWDMQRIHNLKAEDGWLNLAGLLWLEEGKNTFGSSMQNRIVFPAGSIASKAGYFERHGDVVVMTVNKGVNIKVDGKPVTKAVIFGADTPKPFIVSCNNLRWTVIKRGDRIGLRLRDLKSPALKSFRGIKRYPVDSSWRITATLHMDREPQNISITNVLGQTSEEKRAGRLLFTIDNTEYSLDALEEEGELFIIFADVTNKNETYPSGRFLYAAKPGTDGKVTLDFNKAYNPPCAFTKYATCPLPPPQNRLAIAVTAGEKKYH